MQIRLVCIKVVVHEGGKWESGLYHGTLLRRFPGAVKKTEGLYHVDFEKGNSQDKTLAISRVIPFVNR